MASTRFPQAPPSRRSRVARRRRAHQAFRSTAGRQLRLSPQALGGGFKRLTQLSFPRRFPIVQFPNLPLIVAFLAAETGKFVDGTEQTYARSVAFLAMTIWAYEELVDGVNWFRRLLGVTYVVITVMRVAHGLHA